MPRVRTVTLQQMKQAGEKIAALTAYDYPTAKLVDAAGMDFVLIGDTLGAVVQGRGHTLDVTMDIMTYHTEMVARAVEHALVVADMPFLSYQLDPEDAARNAGRLIAQGGAQAVKLEGPADKFAGAIDAILRCGIPVMGHIGFTPQSVHQIGGYKVQGRGEASRTRLKDEALGLEQAGCFAVVLELVTADLAAEITQSLEIPTIGIGSGAGCDGQILVLHDMIGLGMTAKFTRVFGDVKAVMEKAFSDYVRDVKGGAFPTVEHEHR